MTLGELIDRITSLLGLEGEDAFKVAQEVYSPGRADYSEDILRYAATKLGLLSEPVQTAPATPMPEMTMDPAEVLREVYLMCPRLVPADEDGKVHIPKLGRAPQDEEHKIPEELLEQLPEDVRVLLFSLDVFNGTADVTFYDEANGVDRTMPTIDLTRYGSADALNEAITTLLGRMPKYLAADWN